MVRAFLRSSEVFAFVGRNQNLKDLKDQTNHLGTSSYRCMRAVLFSLLPLPGFLEFDFLEKNGPRLKRLKKLLFEKEGS